MSKINYKLGRWFFILLVILLIVFLNFIIQGVSAEFFDNFGIFVFIFLLVVGIWGIKTKKKLPEWIYWVILIIAVLGLLVDSFNVIRNILGRLNA